MALGSLFDALSGASSPSGSSGPSTKPARKNGQLNRALRRYIDVRNPVPKPPTIDEARMQRQETDRIRRRRGTLANIQAGESAPATVGTRVLLGG